MCPPSLHDSFCRSCKVEGNVFDAVEWMRSKTGLLSSKPDPTVPLRHHIFYPLRLWCGIIHFDFQFLHFCGPQHNKHLIWLKLAPHAHILVTRLNMYFPIFAHSANLRFNISFGNKDNIVGTTTKRGLEKRFDSGRCIFLEEKFDSSIAACGVCRWLQFTDRWVAPCWKQCTTGWWIPSEPGCSPPNACIDQPEIVEK